MIHFLARSQYYGWSVRQLRSDAAHAPDRRQRWQNKGAVAGALLGDTIAAPARLWVGTRGFGKSCTQPDLATVRFQRLGALGALNCGIARCDRWVGRGVGAAVGFVTAPLGLLLGRSASAWIQGGAARGALLGVALGRLRVGPAELSRSFSVYVLELLVRVLTGLGELVGGAAADFYALGSLSPEEALGA